MTAAPEQSKGRAGAPVAFLATAALLVAALRFCSDIPAMTDTAVVLHFEDLSEAQNALGRHPLPLPSYFPTTLEWPPAEILVHRRDDAPPAVLVHFRDSQHQEMALAIALPETPALPARLVATRHLASTQTDLGGIACVEVVGTMDDQRPCNQIRCSLGDGRTLAVTATLAMHEVRRITASLHRYARADTPNRGSAHDAPPPSQ